MVSFAPYKFENEPLLACKIYVDYLCLLRRFVPSLEPLVFVVEGGQHLRGDEDDLELDPFVQLLGDGVGLLHCRHYLDQVVLQASQVVTCQSEMK